MMNNTTIPDFVNASLPPNELEMIIDIAYQHHLNQRGRTSKKRLHPTRQEYGDIFLKGMMTQKAITELGGDNDQSKHL
jgi:hypothetical protein